MLQFLPNTTGLASPNQSMLTQQLGQPVRGGVKPLPQTMQMGVGQPQNQFIPQGNKYNPDGTIDLGGLTIGKPITNQAQPQQNNLITLPDGTQRGLGLLTPPGGFDFSGGMSPQQPQVPQQPQGGFNQPQPQIQQQPQTPGLGLITDPNAPQWGTPERSAYDASRGLQEYSPLNDTQGFQQQPQVPQQPQGGFNQMPTGEPVGHIPGTPLQQQAQPQPQQPQPQPQFGLSGAEQALRQGNQAAVGAIGQGVQAGVGAIGQGQQSALNTLLLGNDVAQQNLAGGVQALGGNFNARALQADPNAGQGQFQQAASGVNQFSPAGLQAQQRQLALSGSLGQEAFDAARINDPAQAFLREQGELGVVNQQAALGGLGGGRVQRELTRFGQGLASQNLQQERDAVNQLSNQGLQAAGQAGQFLSQAGQTQAQLAGQNAQLGTQTNLANARNELAARQGQANLFGQGAGIGAQLAGQGAGMQFTGGQNLANIFGGAGSNVANLFSGTGQNLAQNRFQTGRDLASQIGQGSSALSNLANQQGQGLGDIIGQGGSNLSNILQNAGQFDSAQQAQLGQLLANLSTGQGSQLSNIALGQGNANAQAALSQGANFNNLMGDLSGAAGYYYANK